MRHILTQHIQLESELSDLARQLLSHLGDAQTVALCGQLGSGKTTFVKALMAEMGLTGGVSSPTFVLQHEYQTGGGKVVEHWDLYRLKELPPELSEPPADGHIRLIEWAEKFPSLMDSADYVLKFELNPGDLQQRNVSLYASGSV